MRRRGRRFHRQRETTPPPGDRRPGAPGSGVKRPTVTVSDILGNVEEIPSYRARVRDGAGSRWGRWILRIGAVALLAALVAGITAVTNYFVRLQALRQEQTRAYRLLADEVRRNLEVLAAQRQVLRAVAPVLDGSASNARLPSLGSAEYFLGQWRALSARLDLLDDAAVYQQLTQFYEALERSAARIAAYQQASEAWNAIAEARADGSESKKDRTTVPNHVRDAWEALRAQLETTERLGRQLQQQLERLAE